MKKMKLLFFYLSPLILVGCAGGNMSSGNKLSGADNSSSNNSNQRYISAKRIYDFQYDLNGYEQDLLTINELPSLVFKRNKDMISFSIDGRTDLGSPKSIYLADFNDDGFVDLGYSQSRSEGSSTSNTFLVRIYDYQNDKLIFDDNNQKNSF